MSSPPRSAPTRPGPRVLSPERVRELGEALAELLVADFKKYGPLGHASAGSDSREYGAFSQPSDNSPSGIGHHGK